MTYCLVNQKKMSRVVVVNKSIKDERLTELFAQMTGAKDADPLVIIPKYNNIRKSATTIIKTLEKFANNTKLRDMLMNFKSGFDEVLEYTVNLNKSLQYETVQDADVNAQNIHVLYKTCKEDPNVKAISVMCARLRKDITIINDLNIYFIGNQPDDTYQPLPFTTINFSHLWAELPESGEVIKKYIMTVFKKLMEKSYEIHNILISPDIDIEEFSQVLIEAITRARSMLPRCKQAFDKIEESISLLKDNFGDYYKSFMISKNPNSILESFVIDVSMKQKGNTRLKWQFMQIVNFYRKHSSGKVAKDSNLNYIFKTLDGQLDQLDKATPDSEPADAEVKYDEEEDDTKAGFRHLDFVDGEKPHLIIIEESRYAEFLEHVSKRCSISTKTLNKKIDAHAAALPKEKTIESTDMPLSGIYRTVTLIDFSKFDADSYVKKIVEIDTSQPVSIKTN